MLELGGEPGPANPESVSDEPLTPVGEKEPAKNLSDVIKRIFSDD